ncbi:MAG: PAS domain-containing protein, partial [Anaerolineae bacterium]|nr:PAS domain-containing protein [Anaerolineae bacterium]
MSGDKDLCRLLFETASDASLVWQDGRVVDCNHSAETMFGSPQQLLIGQTAKQLWSSIQPDPNSSNHSFYDMLAAATPGQQEAFDCQLQRSDGVTFYAQVTLRAVEFGQEVIVHTSIRDVTEQKQAVKALEQQQAFLRQLIDLNPHFIFVKDREGRFALTNQAFAEAYGTTVEALIGKTDADVNPSQEMVDH